MPFMLIKFSSAGLALQKYLKTIQLTGKEDAKQKLKSSSLHRSNVSADLIFS